MWLLRLAEGTALLLGGAGPGAGRCCSELCPRRGAVIVFAPLFETPSPVPSPPSFIKINDCHLIILLGSIFPHVFIYPLISLSHLLIFLPLLLFLPF